MHENTSLKRSNLVHVDHVLDPPPPCGLTWTIERPPPSPYLSTWFMNPALFKKRRKRLQASSSSDHRLEAPKRPWGPKKGETTL